MANKINVLEIMSQSAAIGVKNVKDTYQILHISQKAIALTHNTKKHNKTEQKIFFPKTERRFSTEVEGDHTAQDYIPAKVKPTTPTALHCNSNSGSN